MYMFEGKNYAKESSAADKKAFDQLLTGEWDQNNLYVVMFVCIRSFTSLPHYK